MSLACIPVSIRVCDGRGMRVMEGTRLIKSDFWGKFDVFKLYIGSVRWPFAAWRMRDGLL